MRIRKNWRLFFFPSALFAYSPASLLRISFSSRQPSLFILKDPVLSFSFLLRSELHWLRCIVMNHNFKLKPSETSVTNDAELLNYALKSARENAVGQPEKKSHFSSCCSSLVCFLLSDVDDVGQLAVLAAHLSFPIFNARGTCREIVGELSRTLHPFAFWVRLSIGHQPFALPCAEKLFFLSTLQKVFNIRDIFSWFSRRYVARFNGRYFFGPLTKAWLWYVIIENDFLDVFLNF